jgi:hypothetical protein
VRLQQYNKILAYITEQFGLKIEPIHILEEDRDYEDDPEQNSDDGESKSSLNLGILFLSFFSLLSFLLCLIVVILYHHSQSSCSVADRTQFELECIGFVLGYD